MSEIIAHGTHYKKIKPITCSKCSCEVLFESKDSIGAIHLAERGVVYLVRCPECGVVLDIDGKVKLTEDDIRLIRESIPYSLLRGDQI